MRVPNYVPALFALVFTASAAMAGVAVAATPSAVKVTLFDKGANVEMPAGLGMASPGADMSKAVMHISAVPQFVKAGPVTFEVTNNSKDVIHEMILVKIGDKTKALPFVAADNKVDEDAAGHLGEVSELDPGKAGSLTLTLDPGTYMLFCNIPGHYMAGMWTEVTVR